jgi:DNA-binding response OmpR family regulator
MKVQAPPAEKALATVLIADDEPSMRLLVRTTIESDHFIVIEAGDGNEAWASIVEHRPALILLDVQMPGRNGLDILASIRRDPALSATRVILLTAKALASDRDSGIAAGADFYLTKPFSPLDLLTRVEAALRL